MYQKLIEENGFRRDHALSLESRSNTTLNSNYSTSLPLPNQYKFVFVCPQRTRSSLCHRTATFSAALKCTQMTVMHLILTAKTPQHLSASYLTMRVPIPRTQTMWWTAPLHPQALSILWMVSTLQLTWVMQSLTKAVHWQRKNWENKAANPCTD